MVVDMPAPNDDRPFKAAGNPIKMSDQPDMIVAGPAPMLDGDRADILTWLDQRESGKSSAQ